MDAVGNYILHIIATGILCGTVLAVTGKSKLNKQLKVLAGLLMAVTVMKPIMNNIIDYRIWNQLYYLDEANAAIQYGEAAANNMRTAIIADNLEIYIQNKADVFGACVSVETMVEGNLPIAVTIRGEISPYARSWLSRWMESELGIPEVNQYWN